MINYQASFVTLTVGLLVWSHITQLKQILTSVMAQDSVTHQKLKKVPEVEVSVDESLSANGSQKQTLTKSRENEALMESQAVPAWAKTHTLPSPPLHLVLPPSLSRTLKLSGSEKLHGWPPSLTELMPVSQKLWETPEDSW